MVWNTDGSGFRPIEQIELGSRLHGPAGTLGEKEEDGYEVSVLRGLAVRVVDDVPASTHRTERARLD